jgi:hypothetical protein
MGPLIFPFPSNEGMMRQNAPKKYFFAEKII